MKKFFALALAALSTVSMFAAIDSQLTLYLDKGDKEVEARIAAGDTYSPFNAGTSAAFAPMYDNPSNIGMYVQYEGGNFMELNAPQLINVPLVIVTSREAAATQNYELFAEAGASHTTSVYVTDLRPDGGGDPYTFELNDLTDYSFTLKDEAAYVEGENSVIADRFVINYVAPAPNSVTTNAYGFCSFASSEDVEFLGGLKAYRGQYNAGTNELTLYEIGTQVPANTGVILWNSNGTAETFNYNTGVAAPAVSDNDFVGVTTAADPAAIRATGKEIYCLNGNALKQYVGTDEIPAGKAYLPISVGGANPAPKHIVMRFNTTTAVENVEAESVKAEKFVEDGQVYIRRGNEVYNLQGQKVNF